MSVGEKDTGLIRPPGTGKEPKQYTYLEQSLLNNYQRNFPLSPRPYEQIARELHVNPDAIIMTLRQLESEKKISRIGPVVRPNTINASMLAAMHVPEEKLVEVAVLVNSYREVNHNYEREHHFNLWFVIHGPDENHVHSILDEIELKTGSSVMRLPILNDFHIDLGFDLQWN